MTSGHLIQSLN